MAAAPRPQQVLREQIEILPDRYTGYHKDLIGILNDALRSVGDGTEKSKRRRELIQAINAKASQLPTSEEGS